MGRDASELIAGMRQAPAGPIFDHLFTRLASVPGLRPLQNHNTLAFYTGGRRSMIVTALRIDGDQVVLAIPHGMVVRHPDVLAKVKAIWQDAPTAGQTVPNNRAALALLVTSHTLIQAMQIIEDVFLPYLV